MMVVKPNDHIMCRYWAIAGLTYGKIYKVLANHSGSVNAAMIIADYGAKHYYDLRFFDKVINYETIWNNL